MWNPSLPAAWALFGKYKSHLKQLDADWQVASCRAEVHINCSCIMLRVRFSAHWKFFYVWGEQVAVDHNWEASANSDLQVYLLANEKEKTLKKTQHNPTKKKRKPTRNPHKPHKNTEKLPKQSFPLHVGWLWVCRVFPCCCNTYFFLCLLLYSWPCEKPACCILSLLFNWISHAFFISNHHVPVSREVTRWNVWSERKCSEIR